jgi:uncharacterized RDD family membrane protein YckC
MDNSVVIDTPESISFTYRIADLGSRFVALLLDTLIQTLIYTSLFGVIYFLDIDTDSLGIAEGWLIALIVIVFFLLFVLYFALFEVVTHGQTPGKIVMNLRVVREDGQPLGILDAVLRNLIRLVDFFPGVYSVGVISMFISNRAKRLGDYAAGTVVVREGTRISLEQVLARSASAPLIPQYKDIVEQAARRMSEEDAALIENMLNRSRALDDADAIARTISESIRLKIASPELDDIASQIEARTLLEQLASAYRQRTRGV